MSRKTTKSILSRDEISLFTKSEELKNTELYGNLYDILCELDDLKAVTLDTLIAHGLNEQGTIILTHKRASLFDNINREWYVESKSAEDPNKKVKCGLCNTPNRYLFYIRNRLNNRQLNVGSRCMTKFPEIEGYANHKYQLGQIQRSQREAARWLQFHEKFPNAESIIDSATYYFDNLPILLPYDIYYPLSDVVVQLYRIHTKYIKSGTTPITTNKTSFELFDEYTQKYNKLKTIADDVIDKNIKCKFVCKRQEIDWMLQTKKVDLLETISKNQGFYTINTIKYITSIDFLTNNFNIITSCNSSGHIRLVCPKDQYEPFYYSIKSEGYSFAYQINIKKFMEHIGAECLFNEDFRFGEKELFNVSKIMITNENINSIIEIVKLACSNGGCAFLIDDTTNDLYLYYKADKSIKVFSPPELLKLYDSHKIRKHNDKSKFIGVLLTYRKWMSLREQETIGIDEKISKLYYHQYIEPYML